MMKEYQIFFFQVAPRLRDEEDGRNFPLRLWRV